MLGYVPKRLPTLKCSAFCDLLPSECKFCFFIADKREDFIHLGSMHGARQRRSGRCFCMFSYPVGNCTMMYSQVASNPAKIPSIDIHFGGAFSQTFRVALTLGRRRVFPLAIVALIPWRTRFRLPGSVLARLFFTVRTFDHFPILPHPFRHSQLFEKTQFMTA